MVMVEKVVVMNCHVQQKVKVGKTVCDEASVVPWEVAYNSASCVEHMSHRCFTKLLLLTYQVTTTTTTLVHYYID